MGMLDALREIQSGNHEAMKVFRGGIAHAVAGLSQMSGREITIRHLEFKKVPAGGIIELCGGPDTLIIAIYLEISGKTTGQMILVYEPAVAFELVDMLLGQPAGSTQELTELEMSTLGEVGNIMGSFFLNYISDATGIRLLPSPPAVMMDMAGAILDAAVARLMEFGDEVYIIKTVFGSSDRQVSGTFLVVPDPSVGAG
ncbi:MAG: chemotaxis protein CheC [Dehalococcoidales bacterium]|nr:chemotaxis protein CheC [Dehalococcoidales bacterium]